MKMSTQKNRNLKDKKEDLRIKSQAWKTPRLRRPRLEILVTTTFPNWKSFTRNLNRCSTSKLTSWTNRRKSKRRTSDKSKGNPARLKTYRRRITSYRRA
jgi:hypothetical protein